MIDIYFILGLLNEYYIMNITVLVWRNRNRKPQKINMFINLFYYVHWYYHNIFNKEHWNIIQKFKRKDWCISRYFK